MTPSDRNIVLKFALGIAAYCAWFALVLYFAFHGLFALIDWMKQSREVGAWIVRSGIPPVIGVGDTLLLWLGPTVLLLWLPTRLIATRGSTAAQNRSWISQKPFSELAARFSMIVPFATAAVAFVILATSQYVFHTLDAIVDTHVLVCYVFWIMASSLLMGVVSLFGIQRYGVRPILWRAAIGIFASVAFGGWPGVYLFFGIVLNNPGGRLQ